MRPPLAFATVSPERLKIIAEAARTSHELLKPLIAQAGIMENPAHALGVASACLDVGARLFGASLSANQRVGLTEVRAMWAEYLVHLSGEFDTGVDMFETVRKQMEKG